MKIRTFCFVFRVGTKMDDIDEGIGSNDSSASNSEAAINNLKSLNGKCVLGSHKLPMDATIIPECGSSGITEPDKSISDDPDKEPVEECTNMISQPKTNGSYTDSHSIDDVSEKVESAQETDDTEKVLENNRENITTDIDGQNCLESSAVSNENTTDYVYNNTTSEVDKHSNVLSPSECEETEVKQQSVDNSDIGKPLFPLEGVRKSLKGLVARVKSSEKAKEDCEKNDRCSSPGKSYSMVKAKF